jgi:hypothetical protein
VDTDDFAWDVLADTVEEDGQMLYEPLVAARSALPDSTDGERQALVERTLHALVGAGLIAVFREREDDQPAPLDDAELDAVLAGRGWRTVPPGPDGSSIWLRATPAGVQALDEEAPPAVRERRAAADADADES